ncbi:MAG: hypothetical protein ACXVZX_00500 [Terriglobales bacterium]
MFRTVLIAAIVSLALSSVAQQSAGIKPRKNAESYPAVVNQPNVALGAEQLSAKQVRRLFVSSLGRDYIVVELGAFPKSEVPLSPQDFSLIVEGQKDVVRPADPNTIADKLAQKEAVNNDVTVSPSVGVTYATGSDPYDPYGRGWTTETGVMVDTGGHRRNPKTVAADRNTMATELKDKQFPAGPTDKNVAGYLYFPMPQKADKGAKFQLQFETAGAKVLIPLNSSSQ